MSGGSSPSRRSASIVLPEPGGPIIRRWWRPAAATSMARRPRAWPRTSVKSGMAGRGRWRPACRRTVGGLARELLRTFARGGYGFCPAPGSLSTFVDGDGDGDGCAEPVQRTGAGGHALSVGLEGATRKRSVTQVSHDSRAGRKAAPDPAGALRGANSEADDPLRPVVATPTVRSRIDDRDTRPTAASGLRLRPGVAPASRRRPSPRRRRRPEPGAAVALRPVSMLHLVRIRPGIEVATHHGRVPSATGHLEIRVGPADGLAPGVAALAPSG